MRNVVLFAIIVLPSLVTAQTPVSSSPTAASSRVPNLSGDWLHSVLISLSQADPRAMVRGKEPDVPYRPETVVRMMKETPASGGDGRFEQTTDPHIQYCEPHGLVAFSTIRARRDSSKRQRRFTSSTKSAPRIGWCG